MIILDTNVVAGLMRLEREPGVERWLDQQILMELYLPTPVMFEVSYGIAQLDAGRKRRDLEARYDKMLTSYVRDRILPFDVRSAEEAGLIFAIKAFRGCSERIVDIQIAGIAKALNASVATRNVKDFNGMGVTIINPWDTV
jgi:toxin FitB